MQKAPRINEGLSFIINYRILYRSQLAGVVLPSLKALPGLLFTLADCKLVLFRGVERLCNPLVHVHQVRTAGGIFVGGQGGPDFCL